MRTITAMDLCARHVGRAVTVHHGTDTAHGTLDNFNVWRSKHWVIGGTLARSILAITVWIDDDINIDLDPNDRIDIEED